MSNVIGNNLKLTLFGESHGEYIGATLSSLPSGIKIDLDYIKERLSRKVDQTTLYNAESQGLYLVEVFYD